MGLLPATVLSTLLWAASSPATLADAIKDYDQFDDAVATDAFQDLLAHNPPGEVAAIAHLYLGLLAFNGFHPDLARAEFKQAIQANPAIEPPPGISPKAKLAFGAVREDMARAMSSSDGLQFSSPSAQAATAAPPPAPTSHSHLLSLTLGGVGVALGVVAVIGGVQVLNYNSLASSANNGPPGTYEGTQFTQSSANFWRYGWIAFAAGGAAALAAGVLTW